MKKQSIQNDQELQKREKKLLVENIQLILDNIGRIISTPKLSGVLMSVSYLSLAYISGGGRLPLGVIASLWKQGEFIADCPKCNCKVFLFSLGGSVLSGCNLWWGVCPTCKEGMRGRYTPEKDGKILAQRVFPVLWEKKRWGCEDDPNDPIARSSGMSIDGESSFALNIAEADGDKKDITVCAVKRKKGVTDRDEFTLEYGLALGDAIVLLAEPDDD